MMPGRPVGGAKATLAGLAQLFLEETARANRSFANSQLALAASLGDATRTQELTRALGGRPTESDVLLSVLRAQAKSASRMAITEVKVTFWAEPAPPGRFERFIWFLRGRRGYTGAQLFRLAPAERRGQAAEFVVRISRTPTGKLEATNPTSRDSPQPRAATELLLGEPDAGQSP